MVKVRFLRYTKSSFQILFDWPLGILMQTLNSDSYAKILDLTTAFFC